MAMRVDGRPAMTPGHAVRVTALAAFIALLGGCAMPGEGDVDQAPPRLVAIEVDVKRALLESDVVGGAAIGVTVDEAGIVTLDGFVDDETERREALRLAREANGGREPVDALEIP